MVSIGNRGKGLFHYDVDVSKFFKAKKGEAIIQIREPTSQEYLLLASLSKEFDEEKNSQAIDLICGLIIGTTIKEGDDSPGAIDLNKLRLFICENGTLYLHMYQEWQKMLPLDRRT